MLPFGTLNIYSFLLSHNAKDHTPCIGSLLYSFKIGSFKLVISSFFTSLEDNYFEVGSYDTSTSAEVLDLKNELDKLNEEEKKIIYSRYYEELTQSETSKLLGISQVKVSRDESKILKKLKTRL